MQIAFTNNMFQRRPERTRLVYNKTTQMSITTDRTSLFVIDIISVEANVAAAFNLRTYETMIMNIVDPASVALDSVEITFKDQYMGRSEMWRLKSFLVRIGIMHLCAWFRGK